jgi:hypothetical protein
MRRASLTLLVCLLVLPTAAFAASRAPGDGTLVVRDANVKTLKVSGRGTIFGRLDRGKITIVDYNPDDNAEPQVVGWKTKVAGADDGIWTYSGNDMRFRFFGGRYTIRLWGPGANVALSAVGRGSIVVTGSGTIDDGEYAVNGGTFTPITVLQDQDWFGPAPVTHP